MRLLDGGFFGLLDHLIEPLLIEVVRNLPGVPVVVKDGRDFIDERHGFHVLRRGHADHGGTSVVANLGNGLFFTWLSLLQTGRLGGGVFLPLLLVLAGLAAGIPHVLVAADAPGEHSLVAGGANELAAFARQGVELLVRDAVSAYT